MKAIILFALATSIGFASSVKSVRLPNDPNYWSKSGFTDIEGLLRLPSDKEHTEEIHVWMKIPDGGKIQASLADSEQRCSVSFPAGTVADRVDLGKNKKGEWEIDDVRGARIDESGQPVWHVYEEAPDRDQDFIWGYEWPRKNDKADKKAGKKLVKLYFPPGHNWHKEVIKTFKDLNRCTNCHQPDNPAPMSRPFLGYESDASGFFQPLSALRETITVREHRDWDLNTEDPFVKVFCGDEPAAKPIQKGDVLHYRCANGVLPTATYDVKSALAAGNAHAMKLCAARKFFFNHMDFASDDVARSCFSRQFEECGIIPSLTAGR